MGLAVSACTMKILFYERVSPLKTPPSASPSSLLKRLLGCSDVPLRAACAFFSAASLSRPRSDGRAAGWRKATAYNVSLTWLTAILERTINNSRHDQSSSVRPSFWFLLPECLKHHGPFHPPDHRLHLSHLSSVVASHASCVSAPVGALPETDAQGSECVTRGWHLPGTCRTQIQLSVSHPSTLPVDKN